MKSKSKTKTPIKCVRQRKEKVKEEWKKLLEKQRIK